MRYKPELEQLASFQVCLIGHHDFYLDRDPIRD